MLISLLFFICIAYELGGGALFEWGVFEEIW